MSKNRSSALRICFLAVVCISLSGCFDTKQEITLNPDGSGKIVMESTFAQPELLLKGPKRGNATPDRVRQLIEEAKGVEAWRDISFRELEDGRLWVRGTAYFRDLSKLKTSLNSFLNFRVTKDAAGGLTLSLRPDTSDSPFPLAAELKSNEPDTLESIQFERKQFRAMQPLLTATFGGIKQETVFHFPGPVKEASNLHTNGPQSLRVSYDGGRIVTAIEHILFDPELTQRRLAAGSLTNFLSSDEVTEQVFGHRGPVRAVILPGRKPLFDYETEVEKARKSFSALARELGLTEPPTERVKPAVDGAPARIKVIGVGWRFEKEGELASFFGGPRQGYTLSLRAELPGAVFSVNEVSITRAATLEGVILECKARTSSGIVVEDPSGVRTNVNFDIHLGSPPVDSKGLAEVSGVLECSSAENRRTLELISGRLVAGAKGKEFGAHLDHVGANNAGSEKLVLRTSLEPSRLLSLYVMNDAGMKVTLDVRGTMNVGKEYSYTCAARHSIPRSGKLVAEALVGSQTLRIPFSVTNLTLLGQPLAAN